MKFKKNKSISINEPNDINVKINTTTWNKAIENLKYDKTVDINQYIFNKLRFTNGDEIQIFPLELTEEMATALGEDAGTIEEVYEPFLIKEGFLKRTPRGREVTELAYMHLGRSIYNSQKTLFDD